MGKKVVKQKKNVNPKKIPKQASTIISYKTLHPSWCFSRSDDSSERWSIMQITKNELLELKNRLSSYERMTWAEIEGDENHFIPIGSMIKDAQDRAYDIKIYQDSLFSLRISGRKRLFGFIQEGVFFIIWYDRNHEVCISHKKHT